MFRALTMRLLFAFLLLATTLAVRSSSEPPEPPREFRGMWIASVGNIDWPTKAGLPVTQQQAELRGLLDTAKRLNLNVVILQVRTACDALYESPFEPWSEYLSGHMGQAPLPKWDPLKFACDEAHARGLELHAWVNPFRARYHEARSAVSANHVTRRHPEWVVSYGKYYWLDPGQAEVREWSLKVITDIVRRYDVDGLHMDDYFYPYPEKANGALLPFPDDASYDHYRKQGGSQARDDWRRENINGFVERVHTAVHLQKPWVKFGLSPFGIWRPGSPPGIKGLDAYAALSADAKLWLNRGWCDYLAPQLYWPTSRRDLNYSALLHWWAEQNRTGRLLVPGLASASVGKDRPASDILSQIRTARTDGSARGVVLWNASSLRDNLGEVATGLVREIFPQPALVPATPWLKVARPTKPELTATLKSNSRRLLLKWSPPPGGAASTLVLQLRAGTQWRQELLPARTASRDLDRRRGQTLPDEVRVVAVGRTGTLGEAAVWLKPAGTNP